MRSKKAWGKSFEQFFKLAINMVDYFHADYSRHSGRGVSRVKGQGRSRESFCKGTDSSRCGSRTSIKVREEREARLTTVGPFQEARQPRGRQ